MKATDIEWTTFSSNPLKYRDKSGNVVWGCIKKSPGCQNCYAEAIALHYRRGGPFTPATMRELTPFMDDAELKKIITAKRVNLIATPGKKVFIGDMTDIFGEWVPFELIDRLFAAFAMRPDMIFQVLTKRPDRMAEYIGRTGKSIQFLDDAARTLGYTLRYDPQDGRRPFGLCPWPLPNVWLGTSVENQATADERIPHLLNTPAAVRFLSCEPLLGSVELRRPVEAGRLAGLESTGLPHRLATEVEAGFKPLDGLNWVIVGGESGAGARPCDIGWMRGIVDQCKSAGVPVFVKQFGSKPYTWRESGIDRVPGSAIDAHINQGGSEPDDELISLKLIDRKGGDPAEWPADLRVRDFPKVGAA